MLVQDRRSGRHIMLLLSEDLFMLPFGLYSLLFLSDKLHDIALPVRNYQSAALMNIQVDCKAIL